MFDNHKRIAMTLAPAQAELLVAHIDGAQVVKIGACHNTRKALVNRGLISGNRRRFPTLTFITEDGRIVLAFLLAHYAEVLTAAGRADTIKELLAIALDRGAPEPMEPVNANPETVP